MQKGITRKATALRRTQLQRSEETKQRLFKAAIRVMNKRGYFGFTTTLAAREAGVTRGALYHHFASKEALFEAVFSAVEDRIGEEVTLAAAGAVDVVAVLRAGCSAWVQLAGDPVVSAALRPPATIWQPFGLTKTPR